MGYKALTSSLIGFCLLASASSATFKTRLLEKYKENGAISAKIKQTKTADYLIEPMVTIIELSRDQVGNLRWDVVSPYKSSLTIQDGKISLAGSTRKVPAGMSQLVGIISNIAAFNLKALENDFNITFQKEKLAVKAAPTTKTKGIFPYQLDLQFNKHLEIQQVLMSSLSQTEKIQLEFLKISKASQ